MRLLVVEDDPQIVHFLKRGLAENGYVVEVAEDGETGAARAVEERFDVVLLDVLLPGIDGFEVCRRVRRAGVATPILMLTARDAVRDRVRGLDVGADDYLAKPFAFAELLARLRALVRRGERDHGPRGLVYGPLEVDPEGHLVRVDGTVIELTATEYRVVELLVRRAETIVSRDQMADEVWGSGYDPLSNLTDVYIARVRKRIDRDPRRPLIHTVRGLGYILKDKSAENVG
jgi:DNA-binding response OmpR family regulator